MQLCLLLSLLLPTTQPRLHLSHLKIPKQTITREVLRSSELLISGALKTKEQKIKKYNQYIVKLRTLEEVDGN